ncbi:mitochondrial outer membrane translocase complex, subunit Tom22 [Sphaerosporella brunnea]|uniref:Mitochondrial outer membrane translocase complex, subunit Tom22 n=1 Tax=Sphaerosporella brunnea TaxID=1250544 RepID=A0A5J5FBQ0_9PEZI|nr:mitochondrial outer membrane translocase complex, subunit Tom22 [Sphaerosporella brunnea]
MVKLQEVEDEHFAEEQPGPNFEDDDEYVDTDSEISSDEESDDDDETFEETVYERLAALKDMVPPKHRARISGAFGATYNAISSVLRFGGNSLWVLSASAIMLGVPYALAVGEEQQMVEMEKEMKAQQLASSGLSGGSQNILDQPGQPQKL